MGVTGRPCEIAPRCRPRQAGPARINEGDAQNLLLRIVRHTARWQRARDGSARVRHRGASPGERLASRARRSRSGRGLPVHVGVGLGGQVAVVHALRAIAARRAAVLVDTLRLALPAADAGAAGPEGSLSNGAGRHRDNTNRTPNLCEICVRGRFDEFSPLKAERKKDKKSGGGRGEMGVGGVPAR